MAEVLVLVEHAEGALKKVSSELLTAAARWVSLPRSSSAAPGTAAPLADALKAAGAQKIYVAESDVVDDYLVAPQVDVLASLVESASPAAVLFAASADGKEIARPARRADRQRACWSTSSRSRRATRACTRSSVAPTPSRRGRAATPR